MGWRRRNFSNKLDVERADDDVFWSFPTNIESGQVDGMLKRIILVRADIICNHRHGTCPEDYFLLASHVFSFRATARIALPHETKPSSQQHQHYVASPRSP